MFQAEYKLHFPWFPKVVANLGYDEISGRTYGNTSLDYAYSSAGNYYDAAWYF
jgi:iron complex outermembrane receptor protein